MDELPSIHERRRRAPLHYWAKADNARFAAYVLSHEIVLPNAPVEAAYGGTPCVALSEAFRREAATAIELIVKAVIAANIEQKRVPQHVTKVPMTHDVPRLWRDANLPVLDNENKRRLLLVKSLLTWSGRYAAPKTDAQIYTEAQDDKVLKPPRGTSIMIEKFLRFDWDDFDHLYQIARTEFHRFLDDLYTPGSAPPTVA